LDKGKLIKKAEKLVKQGRLENALQEYMKVLKENPNDWAVVNIVGDIFVRLERKEEAVGYFKKLAGHYEKDGFYLKAIAIYKKIVKLMPSSLPDCLRLAQLYVNQGLPMEAKGYYLKVAQDYLALGKSAEALEIYQKLVNIDPNDVSLNLKLAELHQRAKNPARAMADLVALGDKALNEGRISEARTVLKKALDIQPDNPEATFKLAEIYCREGAEGKALFLFGRLLQDDPDNLKLITAMGEIYLRMGKLKEAEEVFQRVIQLNPDDMMAKLQLGLVAVEEGDVDKAFGLMEPAINEKIGQLEYDKARIYLSQLLRKNERHPPTLEKLAKVYTGMSDIASLVKTLKTLSEIYIDQRNFQGAVPVLERLSELKPDVPEYGQKLHLIRGQLKGVAPPEEVAVGVKEEEIVKEEVKEEEEEAAEALAQPSFAGVTVREEFTKEEKQQINNAIVEAEIFIKYGLIDKAVDKVSSLFPDCYHSIPLHETLKKAYLEQKDYQEAAKEYAILVKLSERLGDKQKAKAEEEEAKETIPDPALFEKALGEFEILAPPVEIADLEEEKESVPFVDIREPGESLVPPVISEEIGKQVEEKGPEIPPRLLPEEGEERLEPMVSSAEKVEAGVKTVTPPPEPEEAVPVSASIGARAEPAPVLENLSERLEEVDFYLDQGFPRNAKELLGRLFHQFPDNPEVLSRMNRLGLDPASIPREEMVKEERLTPFSAEVARGISEAFGRYEPSSPVGVSGGGKLIVSEGDLFAEEESFFNLSRELGEDFLEDLASSPEQTSFDEEIEKEDLVSDIKGGLGKTVSEEDYQTHYNLGIAYEEMNLIEEAIAEFQVSLKNPSLYIQSCSMLGICFTEKGMPELAIKWFEKGLEKAAGEEKEGLIYYLAQAYSAAGDKGKALALYRQLYKINPKFQDVAERIKSLEK
jgi:pilus assembly protein FimV